MNKRKHKLLNYICMIVLLLSITLPSLGAPEVVEASGTRMPASSTMAVSTVATDMQIPAKMQEIVGTIDHLKNNMDKIYPTAKGKKGLYWGENLPFDLRDPVSGSVFPGYCAQSYAYASKNMVAKGLVTDPRVLKLIAAITPNNPSTPSDAQQVAVQVVLWGAINNNWSPALFSGNHVSLDENAYDGMRTVATHVKTAASQWANIVSDTAPVKPLKPNKPKLQASCHKTDIEKGALVEVVWDFSGGGAVTDLSKIADVKYDGFGTVYHGSDAASASIIKEYGLTPKKNADYLLVQNAKTPGQVKIAATIKYKNGHKPLNNITLIHFEGGATNQPFIMPRTGRTTYTLDISWNCVDKPKTVIPDVPTPESGGKSIPVRWYNMPSAFGEIKNGSGYNESGITTSGKYAQSRSSETFEAMNGVPSTERFYVNLGGTEGYLDVTYASEEVTQDFVVAWETEWEIPKKCGVAPKQTDCPEKGTESFDKTFSWTIDALHLKEATFRVFGDGAVSQGDLDLDLKIINSAKEMGSYNLQPSKAGLEVGPGVGDSKYNIGATSSWTPSQGSFTTAKVMGRKATESDGKSDAYGQANGSVGQLFAQNDALEITIKGTTYKFVSGVNKKTSEAFKDSGPYILSSTDNKKEQYFLPVGEKWDVWSHVPVAGYTGNPEADSARNVKGTPLLLEDLPVANEKGNGIYGFEETESGNLLDYQTAVTVVKGTSQGLNKTVDNLDDGKSKGTSTVYGSAKDPIDPDHHIEGNFVQLQYTNWQVPVTTGKGVQFNHSGKKPDNNKNASLEDNPTYRSINPILIHNPTTALYGWISDIPDSQLQDQRINGNDERIAKHGRTQSGNARQYIDYDFQLTIPNTAAFNKYWSQVANNSQEAGNEDLDFTYPGTLGKGYKASAVGQVNSRSYQNPYGGASGWDVSKWNTAKYVKFPYDVYYYKNSGEEGGDGEGFYEAGDWIKLYDDNRTVKVGDPTTFNFHVASEQKDVKDGIIYVTSEALNAPDSLAGNADALYRSGEQYVNGTRNVSGTNLGNYNTERDGEALYSAVNQMNVDGIGRIGNVLVSDTSDPAWDSVFWKTTNGKVSTVTPVQQDYGLTYNMYESRVLPNATGFSAYDRYKSLTEWHGQSAPLHSLPLTTNVLTKGKTDQTVKLGYNIGGSIQTVGDYDYSMWIYPQNQLAGKFTTGNASDHFKLITSDPFAPGAKFQEYYDSDVNNTLHGKQGILGKNYAPRYQHLISSSLADPRMKMSNWEKTSTTYQKAVQLGSSKKILTGTPSWMVVPQALRTLIGSDNSEGRWGVSGENNNNFSGSKDAVASVDCPCSYENVQKWNWNYSLPQNTKIWFDQKSTSTSRDGTPKFEAATKDQYILTSMTFRTKVTRDTFPGVDDMWQTNLEMPAIEFGNTYLVARTQATPDWDLTMYTNTGVNTLPDILSMTKDTPKGVTPSTNPSAPNTWDPTQEGNIGAPMLDIVWWNYSKPATSDTDNIGTH